MKKTNPVQSAHQSLNNRVNLSQQGVVRDSPRRNKRGGKTLLLYIPENIDLDALLNEHPIDVPNAKDYIVYLLHLIHAVSAYRNNADINETNGYTILSSTIIQDKVDNYAPLFEWCILRGFIECDNQTILKKKSLGYRFTSPYRVKLKEQPITLKTLIRKIVSRKRASKKNLPVLQPENLYNFQVTELRGRNLGYSDLAKERLHYLEKWFHSNLTINTDSSEQYLKDLLVKEEKDPDIRYPIYNYNCRSLVLKALKNRDNPRFKVDDKSGRLHTNLTSLKSELKAFLRFGDKKIASADIKNSQPLLSLVFLDMNLFYKNKMPDRIALYNDRYKPGVTSGDDLSSLCSMLGDFIQKNEKNKDILLYKGLVLNGKIYEYFGKILQGNDIGTNLDDYHLRKLAKRELFRAFFDRNQAIYRRDSHGLRLFKSHFPTVFEIFSLIKAGKHNTLACALQNLEAEIVLHKACKTLSLINSEMLLLTIHDSIASTIENYELVKTILTQTLFDALEVMPEVEREVWDESLLKKSETKSIIKSESKKGSRSCEYGRYGYVDENDIINPATFSMKYVANLLGIGHRTLCKGLRQAGVFVHDIYKQNCPLPLYSSFNYFTTKTSRRGRRVIQTPRVTTEGIDFIKEIVRQNPELFPEKKIKVS